MERGVGGRIEAAFEAAKEKGEAAFVTFITAGYPNAQGKIDDQQSPDYNARRLVFSLPRRKFRIHFRYTCFADGYARRWCICD